MPVFEALFGLAAAVFAQDGPASAPAPTAAPTTVEGVTVEGPAKPLDQRVREFVAATVSRQPNFSLIRWRAPICPLVSGLPRDEGEYILARLSEVARSAGAPLAGADCRPNLYVVVNAQPRALLDLWRRRDRGLFGDATPTTVARFIETDRPVRAWHNWRYESPWGGALPKDGLGAAPVPARASRLTDNVVRNATSAIIVVDAGRLEGVTLAQLADYVAMVGLASLRPKVETGDAPTILALFEARREPPSGITPWDEAFLRGLYSTPQEHRLQRAAIARRILREVSGKPGQEAP